MDISFVNYWAVLVAALSGFVLGGVWYSPIMFQKIWMVGSGVTEEQAQSAHPGKVFGGAFLFALLSAFALTALLGPSPSLGYALHHSVLIGIAFVAASFGINYLFEQKSLSLYLVNAGYHVVQFALMGLVFGVWPS